MIQRISDYFALLALFIIGFTTVSLHAQSYRSSVNEGNELYREKKYPEARKKYEAATAAKPDRRESFFNAGNSAYRTDDIKTALEQYKKAAERSASREEVSQSLYNVGNTFMSAAEKAAQAPPEAGGDVQSARMEGYRNAIEAYKHSLKLNPEDQDTRYNLSYAMRRLEELKNQQNSNKQNNKDKQKQDKQKQDKQKQDQQNKDQQNKKKQQEEQQKQQEQQKEKQDQQQQKQQPQDQKKMSKQQAEQILRALERQEKDLQKKLRQKRATTTGVDKDW